MPAAKQATFDKSRSPSIVDEITIRRAKAGKLVAGVAAASDSDMFKGSVGGAPFLVPGRD